MCIDIFNIIQKFIFGIYDFLTTREFLNQLAAAAFPMFSLWGLQYWFQNKSKKEATKTIQYSIMILFKNLINLASQGEATMPGMTWNQQIKFSKIKNIYSKIENHYPQIMLCSDENFKKKYLIIYHDMTNEFPIGNFSNQNNGVEFNGMKTHLKNVCIKIKEEFPNIETNL